MFEAKKQCLRPKNNVLLVSNNVFSQKTMFDGKKQCLTASNIEKSRRSLEKGAGVYTGGLEDILSAFPDNKDGFR